MPRLSNGRSKRPSTSGSSESFEKEVLLQLAQLQSKLDDLSQKMVAPIFQEQASPNISPRVSAVTHRSKPSVQGKYKPSATGAGYELRGVHPKGKTSNTRLDEQVALVNKIYERTAYRRRGVVVWRFFEDPTSSTMAYLYSQFVPIYIIFTVFWALLEFVPQGDTFHLQPSTRDALQICFESLFVLELSLRFLTCPNAWLFWMDFYNIAEAGSGMALAIRIFVRCVSSLNGAAYDVILVMNCLVPVLRLLKLMRRFEHFQLLISAFRSAAEALPVLLFTLLLITLTFSGLVFYVEQDMFSTYFNAIFFTVVTMSTVGYGDQVPETAPGKCIVGILIIISGLYLAIPIGIVGNAFSLVWAERGRLLVLQRLRRTVTRAGFTFSDLTALFHLFDADGSGALDLEEFTAMIEIMQIGMQPEWTAEVFETFDDDGEGSVDIDEFLNGVFPRAHQLMRLSFFRSSLDSRVCEKDSSDETEDPSGTEKAREHDDYCFLRQESGTSTQISTLDEGKLILDLKVCFERQESSTSEPYPITSPSHEAMDEVQTNESRRAEEWSGVDWENVELKSDAALSDRPKGDFPPPRCQEAEILQ